VALVAGANAHALPQPLSPRRSPPVAAPARMPPPASPAKSGGGGDA
jgi:hypothetical protein